MQDVTPAPKQPLAHLDPFTLFLVGKGVGVISLREQDSVAFPDPGHIEAGRCSKMFGDPLVILFEWNGHSAGFPLLWCVMNQDMVHMGNRFPDMFLNPLAHQVGFFQIPGLDNDIGLDKLVLAVPWRSSYLEKANVMAMAATRPPMA